eukprot:sb/3468543/
MQLIRSPRLISIWKRCWNIRMLRLEVPPNCSFLRYLEFYVRTESGEIIKNVDAILFLYKHVDPKVYWLLRPFYIPLDLIFRHVWLPNRFQLYGRCDVRMELEEDERQVCTRDKSSIKIYADTGCRFSYPEVQTIADRAKQMGKHPIEIVDVLTRSYNSELHGGLTRKDAMLEFHVRTESGDIIKNFDAILFLYKHVDPKVYWLLRPFYIPLDLIFRHVWLPNRFQLYGRCDVRMELEEDERYLKWKENLGQKRLGK